MLALGRQWVFAKRGSTQRKFCLYTLPVTMTLSSVTNTFKAPYLPKHPIFSSVVTSWPIALGHGACCQIHVMIDALGASVVCVEEVLFRRRNVPLHTALTFAWVTCADASQSYFPQGHTQLQLKEASMQPWAICQRMTGGGMRMTPSRAQTGWVTRCVKCSVGPFKPCDALSPCSCSIARRVTALS